MCFKVSKACAVVLISASRMSAFRNETRPHVNLKRPTADGRGSRKRLVGKGGTTRVHIPQSRQPRNPKKPPHPPLPPLKWP